VDLRSVGGGKAVEKEGVAQEKPLMTEEGGMDQMVVADEENVVVATFGTDTVAVEFREKRRRLEDEVRVVEEDVVVGGKIVPLGALEPRKVEVVEVGSSTVVPRAPRATQVLREGEVVHGAPAGHRGRGGTGVGMGLSRGGGLNVFGRGDWGGSMSGGVTFRGGTRGFYARGRGRGGGRDGQDRLFFLLIINHSTHYKCYG